MSTTRPGQTGTATVRLKPGTYAVIDSGSEDGPPPSELGAKATFKVTGDNGAEVAETASKVVGVDKGKDKYDFEASGLKAGSANLTFDNKSKQIHHVVGFPIKGKATLNDVKKALAEERPSGPPPVDFEKGFNTTVLDGKRKMTSRVKLVKGRNVLICFLTDRDGKGKSHFQEGMIREVVVK